jgi:hypothetical protein
VFLGSPWEVLKVVNSEEKKSLPEGFHVKVEKMSVAIGVEK